MCTLCVRANSEIAEIAAFFHDWRVEIIQLTPRLHEPSLSCARFRSHRILRFRAGAAVVVRGRAESASTFSFLSAAEPKAVRIFGRALRGNEIAVACADVSFDILVPIGATLFFLILESPNYISRREVGICNGSDLGAHSVVELSRRIKAFESRRSEIDTTLANVLSNSVETSAALRADGVAGGARAAAVGHACRLIEWCSPQPLMLSELAAHCGVAERTIEYGFREIYDTTPLTYLRCQRLTRSRRLLLESSRSGSICEIARACGFTHMGQYATDYRRLFGETPSATRARGQSAHQTILPSTRRRSQ